jgi:hypothetical protein
MDEVSQNGRRKPRPWTTQEQTTLEVAAACGVPLKHIAKAIDRPGASVRHHLLPGDRAKNAERSKAWANANQERWSANQRAYRKANCKQLAKYRQKHYADNRDTIRVQQKNYRAANSEQLKRYRLKNAAKRRSQCAKWYQQNQQRVRAYYQKNKERFLAYGREYAKRRPEVSRAKSRRYQSIKRAAYRRALLPLTSAAENSRRAIWHNRCAFCGVDAKHPRNCGHNNLAVEHVMALTKHGLDEASNIMPACKTCNSSKSNSPVEDWYRSQPFFTEARWRKIQRHCPAAVVGQLPLAFAA